MEYRNENGELDYKTTVKCKGMTICDISSKCINFLSMVNLVLCNTADVHKCYLSSSTVKSLRVPQIQFRADRFGVMVKRVLKTLNFTYRKRRICRFKRNPNRIYHTRPFGWKDSFESAAEEESDEENPTVTEQVL